MQLSVLQAILIGFYYWFGWSLTPYGGILFTPLPASVWVGLIMGNVPGAIAVGATVQLIYMGLLYAGGQTVQDELAATLVAIPMVLVAGLKADAAIAIAVPIGLIGAQLANLQQVVMSPVVHMCDKAAEKGDVKKFYFASLVMPHLVRLVVRWLPISILVYLGSTVSELVANNIPESVMNALSVCGGLMPAVGFSIVAFVIGKKKLFPFLFAGFFLVQYTGLNIVAAALVGAFITYLYYLFTKKNADPIEEASAEPVETHTILTKRDLRKTKWLLQLFASTGESYERKQAPNFCAALLPCLRKIYANDPEGLREAMVRHMEFFNTEADFGACIPGITLAMEEQKKLGAPITGESITAVKTGLMGPFAGIGDAGWGIFQPLIISLFIGGAMNGSVFSALAPVVLFSVVFIAIMNLSFNIGYKGGTNSVAKLLGTGGFNDVINVFSVLGMFMMGVLAANYISCTTPLVINTSAGVTYAIQEFLDSLLPGLLPLGVFFLAYWITKKRKNYLVTALVILAIALVCGFLGILA